MKPHDRIREAREKLGLSVHDVASRTGVEFAAYRDIEFYPDEGYAVVPLGDLRSICRALDLDLLTTFDIADLTDGATGVAGDPDRFHRNELILRRRSELGLTREQLGDLIGFETVAVEGMEHDADFLEQWPLERIEVLANALRVPSRALI